MTGLMRISSTSGTYKTRFSFDGEDDPSGGGATVQVWLADSLANMLSCSSCSLALSGELNLRRHDLDLLHTILSAACK